MKNRNFRKLCAEYDKKREKLGDLKDYFYLSDWLSIIDLAKEYANERNPGVDKDLMYDVITIALKAGFMIGYKRRKIEEKEARAAEQGTAAGTGR